LDAVDPRLEAVVGRGPHLDPAVGDLLERRAEVAGAGRGVDGANLADPAVDESVPDPGGVRVDEQLGEPEVGPDARLLGDDGEVPQAVIELGGGEVPHPVVGEEGPADAEGRVDDGVRPLGERAGPGQGPAELTVADLLVADPLHLEGAGRRRVDVDADDIADGEDVRVEVGLADRDEQRERAGVAGLVLEPDRVADLEQLAPLGDHVGGEAPGPQDRGHQAQTPPGTSSSRT
jgi:hypothetical protein